MIDIYTNTKYYIPTYIEKKGRSSPYAKSMLDVVQDVLKEHTGAKKISNLYKADYILSDQLLTLTARDTLTFMDIYEAIKLESRSAVWTEPEIKNLCNMLVSKDNDTQHLANDIVYGMNTSVLKECIVRGYITNESFLPKWYMSNTRSDWEIFSRYYIETLIKRKNKI